MAAERTLSIIKPDAVEQNNIGNILAMIQGAGLEILGMRMLHLSRAQAEGFYEVHKKRPFFGELVEFMTTTANSYDCWQCKSSEGEWQG